MKKQIVFIIALAAALLLLGAAAVPAGKMPEQVFLKVNYPEDVVQYCNAFKNKGYFYRDLKWQSGSYTPANGGVLILEKP